MLIYILSFVLSLLVSSFIVLRRFSLVGMDQRTGVQNLHQVPTPRIGGLAIFLAFSLGCFLSYLWWKELDIVLLWSLSALIFSVGFWEDLTGDVHPILRLLMTLLAASLSVFFLGAILEKTGIKLLDHYILLDNHMIMQIVFSILVIATVTNGFNIIDGLNGLLLMQSLFISAVLGYLSGLLDLAFGALFTMIIFYAVLGALGFNFPKAFVFTGDGGAYFLGFLLIVLGVKISHEANISPVLIGFLFFYPAFETVFSFFRKIFWEKGSPFRPDSYHLHIILFKIIARRLGDTRYVSYANVISSLLLSLVFSPIYGMVAVFGLNIKLLLYSALGALFWYTILYGFVRSVYQED